MMYLGRVTGQLLSSTNHTWLYEYDEQESPVFFSSFLKGNEKCAISTVLTNGEEILFTRFSFRETLSHLSPQGRDCTSSSVSLVSKDGQDASSLPRILLASASTRMLFAHRLGRTGQFRALMLTITSKSPT